MDALMLGVEHEFVVSSAAGVVDFRTMIHGLELGQPNLDPTDPNSYRLPSGAAVTSDGAEAEFALAPIAVRPGFSDEVVLRASVERSALAQRLGPDHSLEGYSTHLSVGVADELAEPICRLYATTFAPAMMLLADRCDSPGLLIRPRPGRVELGVEFVEGSQLAAAAVFAVGSVLACEAAIVRADGAAQLPEALSTRVEPAAARFGWYVDRTAFGGDLLADGRAARVSTTAGGMRTAQSALARCWEVAREALDDLIGPEEVQRVQDAVDGNRLLPIEASGSREEIARDLRAAQCEPTPFGEALAPRHTATFEMAPVMLTWDLVVFLVRGKRERRQAFAAVPGVALSAFLGELESGRLDEPVRAFLNQRHSNRVLRERADLTKPALFDEIGPRIALLPPELGRDGLPMQLAVAVQLPSHRRVSWRGWLAAMARSSRPMGDAT